MLFSNIMVTGCGGDIGIAIGRILKQLKISARIIGCDIHDKHPGKAVFDRCDMIEPVNSDFYLESILDIVDKEKIDLVIPACEAEIRNIYKNNFYDRSNLFLTTNYKTLKIGFDKLSTVEFLKQSGLPYPWTRIVGQQEPKALPCIAKCRDGRGSKNIFFVRDMDDVSKIKRSFPDSLWQEYLYPDDEEYTCGVYGSHNNEVRSIILKRKLVGGCTGSGIVVSHKEIHQLIQKVAALLELRGSMNVQLRLTQRGPIIFEINPRFSSTVMFRHLMGFKDLLWSLQAKACEKEDEYVPPQEKTEFYRVFDEVIFNN